MNARKITKCDNCLSKDLCISIGFIKFDDMLKSCRHFKNKNTYVDFPCRIGDKFLLDENIECIVCGFECDEENFWTIAYKDLDSGMCIEYLSFSEFATDTKLISSKGD